MPGAPDAPETSLTTVKTAMLQALASSRQMEGVLVAASEKDITPEAGRWAAREHLDHVAFWREHAAGVLDAVRSGTSRPQVADAIDEQNALVAERYRGQPAAVSRQHAEDSYQRLREAIDACSDDDLRAPDPLHLERSLWEVVPGCSEEHLGGHVIQWNLEQGDDTAAEATARRVHELEVAYPDPRRHAVGTYNLGCFYALRGRYDDALILVREAFQLDPQIRRWADEDPDMDMLREHL